MTATTPKRRPLLTVLALVLGSLAFGSAPASAAETFTNSVPITIPTHEGAASPYPSQIDVQGQPGRIAECAHLLGYGVGDPGATAHGTERARLAPSAR